MLIICEICHKEFDVKPYRAKTARFCSVKCRARWVYDNCSDGLKACSKANGERMRGNKFRTGLCPTNAFREGHKTWNKGMKGIHLSPLSEFKAGERPEKRAKLGEQRNRKCRGGEIRCFVKVAHPNSWMLRAHHVWIAEKGDIPKGNLIHHHDRDPLNDDISNLRCLTRKEHIDEHRDDLNRWPYRDLGRAL